MGLGSGMRVGPGDIQRWDAAAFEQARGCAGVGVPTQDAKEVEGGCNLPRRTARREWTNAPCMRSRWMSMWMAQSIYQRSRVYLLHHRVSLAVHPPPPRFCSPLAPPPLPGVPAGPSPSTSFARLSLMSPHPSTVGPRQAWFSVGESQKWPRPHLRSTCRRILAAALRCPAPTLLPPAESASTSQRPPSQALRSLPTRTPLFLLSLAATPLFQRRVARRSSRGRDKSWKLREPANMNRDVEGGLWYSGETKSIPALNVKRRAKRMGWGGTRRKGIKIFEMAHSDEMRLQPEHSLISL
ncbi:hypothetical protein B0H14DRAFT_2588440 [Mycena olivaceomarginata]|nr:hypothetical protein B0H14DRAFT_2588440 [Mycena olivaceomarginata]